ncbi:acetylxylan esterase [Chitinophaga sp. OAE865]|uniref:alpha/beta hydrolase family protein n=1 Tax=Chitinophaga sp. OAE865 TaxID=2817898 RepID=UPI001AE41E38
MKTLVSFFMVLFSLFHARQGPLPKVFSGERTDIIQQQLKQQAATAFQAQVLPAPELEWAQRRRQLKAAILQSTGAVEHHALPLQIKETGRTQLTGYHIRNILFQTRPGVFATANLYIPDGKGPFPAVINMHGHWKDARMGEMVQATAHSLALNGYVCLNIDAWGAGERTTDEGVTEYHGANLGASLMNTGNTLLGMQLTDNMRGVDLLCSLPEVDKERIGATGASGGGNQTMWLSAMDERIKAAVPVVSVGTFESYIMNSNCVCELVPDGLTYTEESGILAMVAPRALKICNALNDASRSFYPSEMLRSYKQAALVYEALHASDKLSYQLFNTVHGYWPEIRETMIGWMDLQLKHIGTGAPKKEPVFSLLPPAQLLTFPNGGRDSSVTTTASWCSREGQLLHERLLNEKIDGEAKRKALRQLLRINEKRVLKQAHNYSSQDGWKRIALETTDGSLIPLLLRAPRGKNKDYVVVTHPGGKDSVPAAVISELTTAGKGIVLADLWGCGEQGSAAATATDGSLPPYHTLARSALWLGTTVQGRWVSDLQIITDYLKMANSEGRVVLNGSREAGVASLFFTALGGKVNEVVLDGSPLSYRFDERAGIDYFTMAIHVPGLLVWGDISLAAALTGKDILFRKPVTMSGRLLSDAGLAAPREEFSLLRKRCKQPGQTIFQ